MQKLSNVETQETVEVAVYLRTGWLLKNQTEVGDERPPLIYGLIGK